MLSTFVSVVKLMYMDHIASQKYESALEGTCRCSYSDVIDCDVELH